MILVVPAWVGNATQIEVRLRTGTVALLFTASTGRRIESTDATPKLVNAAIRTARPCHVKTASGKSFRSESEPGTQTGISSIHCEIPRLTGWEKWTSFALSL
jgi:hypothetical protein